MRSPAYFTWNTTIAFASILRELLRRFSHNINNGHSADYVLSAACEVFSRRFPIRSTSAAFDRAFWHPHRQHQSAHRDWFALVSHSFPITRPHLLIFRFLWIASLHSLYTIVQQRKCSVWDYNSVQLQGLTSSVCGKYCCLFALYMDRGYTPKQFIGLLAAATADKHVSKLLESEFGPLRKVPRGGQCSNSRHKR